MSAAVAVVKAKRNEPRSIVLLALLLGSQPVATDLYLPALPAIAAELGNPALTLTGLLLAFGFAQLIRDPLGLTPTARLLNRGSKTVHRQQTLSAQ